MICYGDRTFCVTPGCTKEHALTPEIQAAAKAKGMALSMAYLCGTMPQQPPVTIYPTTKREETP